MSFRTKIYAYSFVLVSVLIYLFVVVPVKEKYFNSIQKYRNSKDYYFKYSEDSPLENDLKKTFKKLKYFPLEKNLIVQSGVKFYKEKDTLRMQILGKSAVEIGDFVRYGKVIFTLGTSTYSLDFFKHINEANSNHYFLPFHDMTNGSTSFLKGRYIDLIVDTSSVIQTIDFNLAYNPFCAYNSNYNCPVPPKKNFLPIEMEAGEMKFAYNVEKLQ